MKEVVYESRQGRYTVGGLGTMTMEDAFEGWVCDPQHPCAHDKKDMVCFTYSEKHKVFVPWGRNSALNVVRN